MILDDTIKFKSIIFNSNAVIIAHSKNESKEAHSRRSGQGFFFQID